MQKRDLEVFFKERFLCRASAKQANNNNNKKIWDFFALHGPSTRCLETVRWKTRQIRRRNHSACLSMSIRITPTCLLERFPEWGQQRRSFMRLAGEPVGFINESHRHARAPSAYITPPVLPLFHPRVCRSRAERLPVMRDICGREPCRCGPRCSVCGVNRRSAGSTRSLRRQAAEWLQTGGGSFNTTCRPANQKAFRGGRLGNGGRMERPRVDELLMSLSFTKTERNFRSGSSECKQTEELQGEGRKGGREGGLY